METSVKNEPLLSKMFFWCGVELFNGYRYEYGGFNHWIGNMFGWRIHYFSISLRSKFGCKRTRDYYDGYHNSLLIGFVQFNWGN